MAKVLVVDDQTCIRQLISRVLVLEGYEVHGLGNAQSVMEYLVSSQPDIVLLDLYMDGPEGFDLLQEIKCQHPNLPVIIVTAYDSHRDDPRLEKADGYIVKSFEFWDEMRQKVAEELGRREMVQTEKTVEEIASPNLSGAAIDAYNMAYESPR
jgi:two-component system NtrC family response regulator